MRSIIWRFTNIMYFLLQHYWYFPETKISKNLFWWKFKQLKNENVVNDNAKKVNLPQIFTQPLQFPCVCFSLCFCFYSYRSNVIYHFSRNKKIRCENDSLIILNIHKIITSLISWEFDELHWWRSIESHTLENKHNQPISTK